MEFTFHGRFYCLCSIVSIRLPFVKQGGLLKCGWQNTPAGIIIS
jgi:hypothetical protein